jgi:histidyl-tRNA synthetase
VIAAVRGVLRTLGFEHQELRLSHTGIIRAILATAGYTPEEQLALYDRLIEGDLTIFRDIELRLPQARAPISMLMDLTGGRVEGLENLRSAFASSLPGIVQPIQELRTIGSTLAAAGCEYVLDLTIVRGFEYYTGPVFQMLIDGQNVAGGGRYDGLIASQEGHSVPACGFAISVEPLMRLLPESQQTANADGISVVPAGNTPEVTAAALTAALQLHDEGFGAELIAAGRAAGDRWRLTVDRQDGKSRYWLKDALTGTTFDAETLEAVQDALRRGGGQ